MFGFKFFILFSFYPNVIKISFDFYEMNKLMTFKSLLERKVSPKLNFYMSHLHFVIVLVIKYWL